MREPDLRNSTSLGPLMSRRHMMLGAVGVGGLAIFGLSAGSGVATAAPAATPKMTMYKDPNCGCCGKWADAARAAGYDVSIVPTPDMNALKMKVGIPDELYSCHTVVVGNYIVEGHVPLDAVKRLLAQRPNIKGLSVPGMPAGSPGMEVPGRPAQPYKVMAFGGPGKIHVFQSVG